ncbi:3-keto-5-aminohexanoate cleavage protein [Natranaerobius thermophilus]|uniref:3-keto-5-aminohexanoate cleavage enzyme n=1 Tax=Natranaerobius thermophilus (strain ATCC BAA-1301 / DSM 18059 / JW/NM-WN-LF) TaxID=457570 RepID=B2A657_NATTJ|nr:3-keto-5-aminohexanoate cleavage protein [Natranaerobius thermophilus]ACB85474.1 3-keto-5-aminohexanoate cleavage enzyme [Natranaerobius thermophilus JW/NM-WN-LF]
MEKLIITAAISGAEATKEDNPNIPVTAEELAEEAIKAEEAGASIIHLHVRDEDGTPTQSKEVFKKAIDAMKERGVTAIIQPSTGGAAGMSFEERAQPVELSPEMATLDCGTTNFGDAIFVNDLPMMREFAQSMKKSNILPELECFEPGHVYNALQLNKEGLLPEHLHFDMVLGVPGAMKASLKNLMFMVDLIPEDATWTVAGVGRHELPLATHAILMGGHVRVGFEDNIYYKKGVLAESNAQLVERIVRLANELDREVATPDEAREILKIK